MPEKEITKMQTRKETENSIKNLFTHRIKR